MARWFNALPHPPLAVEIAPEQISLARWSRTGLLEDFAVEPLPSGALLSSAVEPNIQDLAAIQAVLEKLRNRLHSPEGDTALLLPDPVIRVFIQRFEDFPRSSQEALPLLRWRLKKNVPFDPEEMLISFIRQASQDNGASVVTALARRKIVREYEDVLRTIKLRPGVVLTSSIAAVALLNDKQATLMVRIAGSVLTTAIVREGTLRGYRCTELPESGSDLNPRGLVDEIFPVAAYYQDTWHEEIQSVKVAGLGARLPEFAQLIQEEFRCPVHSLLESAMKAGQIAENARSLAEHELEGLLGWMSYPV